MPRCPHCDGVIPWPGKDSTAARRRLRHQQGQCIDCGASLQVEERNQRTGAWLWRCRVCAAVAADAKRQRRRKGSPDVQPTRQRTFGV